MGKIKNWLKGGRNYEEGLVLLAGLTKNRVLVQSLGRKPNPEKLEYELKKLAGKDVKVIPLKVEKKLAPPAPKIEIPPLSTERTKIIRGTREIRLEELPKRLQELYLKNTRSYHEMRTLHEKAKIEKDEAKRGMLTAGIVELDRDIRKNWDTIDAWDGQKEPEGGAIDHRRINANRKYISSNLKRMKTLEGKKLDEVKTEMQKRITELLTAGERLEKASILINLGFEL